jgi:two-component system, OmpR family, phosphate regulon sensor histidine kinase PhoR
MVAGLIPLSATILLAIAVGSVGGWLVGVAVAAFGFLLCALAALHRLHRIARFATSAPKEFDGADDDALLDQLVQREKHLRAAAEVATAQRESVQLAVRALPDAVIVLDAAQRVVWCNDASDVLLGIKNTTEGRAPISQRVRDHAILALLQNPENSALTLPSPIDEDRVLALSTIRCDNDTRVLIARDVTGMKRIEAVRRDFIANLSHELKTPLTVIAGFSETLLADEPLPAAQIQRGLEHIKTQSDNMRRLVQDLLLLSRLESASGQAEKQTIDLNALVERCVDHVHALAGAKQSISVSAPERWLLLGQEEEIESALNNLLTNAFKYSREDGRIEVIVTVGAARNLLVSVKDNGQGIATEHVPRLTERFYRVDRGRSRAAGGTGLGLAIVKHIMNRHDGKLMIESQPGVGSTFSLDFPDERVRAAQPASTIG